MQTADILHYAFRSRDPERLGLFYADLFEGRFFVHPVMCGLGIVMVKLNHPEALFRGVLEFWPWDVVWDSSECVFRRVQARASSISYGHLAVKVCKGRDGILAELHERGIPHRMEPRGPGFLIPTIDDPEGNMIELFPNIEHMAVPPSAICSMEQAPTILAALRKRFAEKAAGHPAEQGFPLTFLDP